MKRLLAALLAPLFVVPVPASAGPLSEPGAPALEPAALVGSGTDLLAIGSDGLLYVHTDVGMEIRRLDDPDAYGHLDRDAVGAFEYGRTLVGLAEDGLSLYVLQTFATVPQPGAPTVGYLFRVVGADILGTEFSRDAEQLGPVNCAPDDCYALFEPPTGAGQRLFGLPGGRVAVVVQDGLLVIDPGDPSTLTRLVSPADLTAAAPMPVWTPSHLLPPWHPSLQTGGPPLDSRWVLAGATPLPGGRLAFLADHLVRRDDTVAWPALRYVLAADAAGTLSVVAGPFAQPVDPDPQRPPRKNPLVDADRLAYDATLDALLVGPILGLDYSHLKVELLGGDGSGNPVSNEIGWTGVSAHVIPLAGGPSAHWNLTSAMVRRYQCAMGGYVHGCNSMPPPSFHSGPDGEVIVGLTQFGPTFGFELFRLTFDPDQLDLDADGLSAGEEATLGTNDYDADSDGGGTPDGGERIAGTDPASATDDPMHAAPRHVSYGTSDAIRGRLPDVRVLDVDTWGIDGPLCSEGACYAADGSVVHTYEPQENAYFAMAARSVDGRFLVVVRGDHLERHDLDTGAVTRLIGRAELEAALGDGLGRTIVPVDASLTFVVQQTEPVRVVAIEGGAVRVVLDLGALRCEEGLGPCDTGPKPQAPNMHGKAGGVPTSEPPPWAALPVHDVLPERGEIIGYVPQTGRLLLGVLGTFETWVLAIHAEDPPVAVAHQEDLVVYFTNPSGGLIPRPVFPAHFHATGRGDFFTEHGVRGPYGEAVPTHLESFPRIDRVSGAWGDTLLYSIEGWTPEDGLYELVPYERRLLPGERVRLVESMSSLPVGPSHGALVSQWTLRHSGLRGGWADLWPAADPFLVAPTGVDVMADGRLCVADRGGYALWEYTPAADDTRVPTYPSVYLESRPVLDCAYDIDGRLYVLIDGGPVLGREATPGAPFTEDTTLTAALGANAGGRLQRGASGEVVVAAAESDEAELTATVPGGLAVDPWTGEPLPPEATEDPEGPPPVEIPVGPTPPTGGDPWPEPGGGCAGGGASLPLAFALVVLFGLLGPSTRAARGRERLVR